MVQISFISLISLHKKCHSFSGGVGGGGGGGGGSRREGLFCPQTQLYSYIALSDSILSNFITKINK